MNDFVTVEVNEELKNLLEVIFNDGFMKKNTRFENFEGFKYSSAVIVNWNVENMVYSKHLMDNFVQESTDFTSWDEMVRIAADTKFRTEN